MFFATKTLQKSTQSLAGTAPNQSLSECGDAEGWCRGELETKVIRRFPKISQSRKRPLQEPSPVWKHLLAISHLRHYAKQVPKYRK